MQMEQVDVVVIGAGVVGLAVAAMLAEAGRDVVIVEAGPAIGMVTSARNSEVIHAGIYYPEGSLKARLCVEGRQALYAWCAARGVTTRKVGKLIVATDDAEAAALDGLHRKAAANGVDLLHLSGAQAMAMEPALSCVAALQSPETGIIDSHGLMLSYLGVAEDHGAMLALNTPVLSGAAEADGIRLDCGGAEPMTLKARVVVNCAGLWAQRVSQSIVGVDPASVPPLSLAKGNYFDLTTAPPFRTLVYPVPVNGGLGVHYTVDMGGRGRFGPDVEWLDHADPDRVDYQVAPRRGDVFYDAVRRYWPGLPDGALAPGYAGCRPKPHPVRAAAEDFMVQTPSQTGVDGLFTLYGIESPGLTASLALGRLVAGYVAEA